MPQIRVLEKGFAVETSLKNISYRKPLLVVREPNALFLRSMDNDFYFKLLCYGNTTLVEVNGERLGAVTWMPNIPFIHKLIPRFNPKPRKRYVNVICRPETAKDVISIALLDEYHLYSDQNNKVKITIPIE